MQRPPIPIETAIRIFRISPEAYVAGARSFEEAQQGLELFKEAIRKEYKILAKELHPDINPGVDPSRFQQLTLAKEVLLDIHLERPRPQPRVRIVVVNQGVHAWSTNTTSTTGTGYYSF